MPPARAPKGEPAPHAPAKGKGPTCPAAGVLDADVGPQQ